MLDKRIFRTLGVVCFALLALAGCRPEEQGRPLNSESGVYPGTLPTASLSEADLIALRQRSLLQGGNDATVGGGGGPTKSGDVRPPLVDTDADKALQQRGKLQSGN